jgi:hypothetical protein
VRQKTSNHRLVFSAVAGRFEIQNMGKLRSLPNQGTLML